jgi:hypothetical protein
MVSRASRWCCRPRAAATGGSPQGRQRHDGHRKPASPATRDRANLSPAGGAASALAGSWSRRIVVALPPGRVDVLPVAVAARGTLVMEPMLRRPTTGTPQPPNCGLDLVPHDGTPPWLHRVSAGRVPMAPCLGLGPVPAGLALVMEFALAGRAPSPPQPRPHRLDPVQHDAPPVLRLSRAPGHMAVTNMTADRSPRCPRWRSLARPLLTTLESLAPGFRCIVGPAVSRTCPRHRSTAVIHEQPRCMAMPSEL